MLKIEIMWLFLNILFLFFLVIIYFIVLNLNMCININNEYKIWVVWKIFINKECNL